MPKTVTLHLDEAVYKRLRNLTERDNRSLSNFNTKNLASPTVGLFTKITL